MEVGHGDLNGDAVCDDRALGDAGDVYDGRRFIDVKAERLLRRMTGVVARIDDEGMRPLGAYDISRFEGLAV